MITDVDGKTYTMDEWDAMIEERRTAALALYEQRQAMFKEPPMNPEIMIIGDTHGDLAEYLRLIDVAEAQGVTKIFQAGDCGLFPAFQGYAEWLDTIQRRSEKANIQNFWIRGNHDDPDEWEYHCRFPNRTGWGQIRSRIMLAPRVHYFKHNGVKFLGVGGAVSIDKQWRLQNEKKPNTLWWPDEIISEEDILKVDDRHIDVLITHECSNRTPWQGRLKPDLESQMNRQRLDRILTLATPDWHFHGHMHTQYEWMNRVISHDVNTGTDKASWTKTIGLECNPDAMWQQGANYNNTYNWGIFDTNTKTWRWKGRFNEGASFDDPIYDTV